MDAVLSDGGILLGQVCTNRGLIRPVRFGIVLIRNAEGPAFDLTVDFLFLLRFLLLI